MGWAELENGELLRAAESANFAVMVTGDKNLVHQQPLRGRRLALIVLSTNNWNDIKGNSGPVVEAVNAAAPGTFQAVTIKSGQEPRRVVTPRVNGGP